MQRSEWCPRYISVEAAKSGTGTDKNANALTVRIDYGSIFQDADASGGERGQGNAIRRKLEEGSLARGESLDNWLLPPVKVDNPHAGGEGDLLALKYTERLRKLFEEVGYTEEYVKAAAEAEA